MVRIHSPLPNLLKRLNLKNIKKNLQELFKKFFYKIFLLIHGNIKGKISEKDDSRVNILISKKESKFSYKIFKVKDARLYTDCIHDMAVILDNFILDGPSYQLRPVNNAKVENNIVFTKGTPRRKKKLKGKILSLLTGGAGNDNYFHWMYDVLPRIGICEKVIDISKIDYFLLPSIEKKYQTETLDVLNIPRHKRLSSKFYRHVVTSEIIITQHPYCIKNDASNEIQNIPIWISQWLKEKCLQSDYEKDDSPKKIYIDRSDSQSNINKLRLIVNETEVKNFLKKQGFEIICLSNFSFKDQVKMMNNAEIIVGLHGAGFGNFCFCKPDTKIIELKSYSAGKMYENLAKSNKLVYKAISCKPEKFDYQNQYGHIKISLKELRNTIESF